MRIYVRGDTPLRYIQIYGERNSATTYLAKILQDNMVAPDHLMGLRESETTPLGTGVFGYKHWFLNWDKFQDGRQPQTLFVVIYRNPYTWIRAMMDRPYALERSLAGCTVADLPSTLLAGHINGKDTKNEFDPDTGEQMTLFELRRKKIEHFEALKDRVDNVAYVSLEELVGDPQGTITRLAEAYGSAFNKDLNLDRAPYKHLIRELNRPKRFADDAQAVLDNTLDWPTEKAIGYRPGDYARPDPRETRAFILHGGSCTGKSSVMRRLSETGIAIDGIEMDDCAYWDDRPVALDLTHLQQAIPGATQRDLDSLTTLTHKLSRKAQLCVDHLIQQLATRTGPIPEHGASPRILVATGGALPTPPPKGKPSIYQWFADRLSIEFHHLLIDIPNDAHIEQIEKRGRTHLTDDILELHQKKRDQCKQFDAVKTGFDDIAAYVARHAGRRILYPEVVPRTPQLRLANGGLKFIQIYGERSSGTKHLKALVSQIARDPDKILGAYSSQADPTNKTRKIGYKHYYPKLDRIARVQHQTLFLVIYKNPYTWIRSMLAKPYHFRADLEGKTIADLPDIRLHGRDIHGNDIPDVHPQTGERLTLFELRKHKIQQWEALAHHVHNVAYVNYEDLLLSPAATLARIVKAFPAAFNDHPLPELAPDPAYVEKYLRPEAFTEDEMAIMDAHLDWTMEALAGYEQGNLFVPDAP